MIVRVQASSVGKLLLSDKYNDTKYGSFSKLGLHQYLWGHLLNLMIVLTHALSLLVDVLYHVALQASDPILNHLHPCSLLLFLFL